VLEWLAGGGLKGSSNVNTDRASDGSRVRRDVFILGDSAGGVHLATWLLAPRFESARKPYLLQSEVVRLCGAALFAVAFHFKGAGPGRGGCVGGILW
jgi:hypothetical protein